MTDREAYNARKARTRRAREQAKRDAAATPVPVALPHGLRQRVATQSYHAKRMMSTVEIEQHVLKEPSWSSIVSA